MPITDPTKFCKNCGKQNRRNFNELLPKKEKISRHSCKFWSTLKEFWKLHKICKNCGIKSSILPILEDQNRHTYPQNTNTVFKSIFRKFHSCVLKNFQTVTDRGFNVVAELGFSCCSFSCGCRCCCDQFSSFNLIFSFLHLSIDSSAF